MHPSNFNIFSISDSNEEFLNGKPELPSNPKFRDRSWMPFNQRWEDKDRLHNTGCSEELCVICQDLKGRDDEGCLPE